MNGAPSLLTRVVGLAKAWVEAWGPIGGSLATGEDLTELAGRLALAAGDGIHDRRQAARVGERIGRQLAEANLTSPEAVRHTVTVLGHHWLTGFVSPREPADPPVPEVDPACVAVMQGSLAAGHAAAVQRLLLAQQEAIHRATITARDDAEQRLRHEVTHDSLTGLANRSTFLHCLDAALLDPHPDDRVALCLLDLDGFTTVNVAHGPLGGDRVLRAVAQRLATAVEGSPALLARFGGDEFAVLLSGPPPLPAADLAARLLAALQQEPVLVDGTQQVRVDASAGVVELPAARTKADAALRMADLALRTAKARVAEDPGSIRLAVHPLGVGSPQPSSRRRHRAAGIAAPG
jgi:diguanylate cyclase (GGDEF)-like protein